VGIAGREHQEIMLQEDGQQVDGGRGSSKGASRKRSAAGRGDAQGCGNGQGPSTSEPKRQRRRAAPSTDRGHRAGRGRGVRGAQAGMQAAGCADADEGRGGEEPGLLVVPALPPQQEQQSQHRHVEQQEHGVTAASAPAGRQPRRGKRCVAVVKYAEPASGDEAPAED
jgi:hypothetical protein